MKKSIYLILLGFIIFLVTFTASYSQQDSLSGDKKLKKSILPIAFYLPETSLGFGVVGIGTFRTYNSLPDSKPSNIQLVATYTLKNQLLIYIPFDIQIDNNRSVFSGEIGFYDYLFNYYGIGTEVSQDDKETYDVIFPRIIINYEKVVASGHFLGGGFAIDHYYNAEYLDGGLLDSFRPLGYEGGTSLSVNLKYRYDTRDNFFTTLKGNYLTAEFLLNTKTIGSDYQYQKLKIDYRYFKTFKKRYTLSANIIQQTTLGDVPFFDMPYIGQSKFSRGVDERKYRDNNLSFGQIEFRYPIFNRIGGVAFNGIGKVYGDFSSFSHSSWKWSYGVGLRYLLNEEERINIRLDYAFEHQEGSAFYLTINEAF